MENTDAEQQPTPEQAAIIERLRLMQAEVDAVKTDLVAKLQESREQVDSLFRELSKVRDELIASKTERRVLSRWYEDAKGERDKIHGELVEVRSALAAVSDERDSLRTTLAAWEAADTAPFVKMPDVADHVMPPVLRVLDAELPLCDKCHTCGMALEMRPGKIACRATLCRSNVSETMMWDYDVNDIAHPYHEPCRSRHPVRHE